ncbi:hypothetical protein B0H14DRAFT_2550118 [Mycena olivaceomarginata]|nr:hypothetical protein B0H14DRAFT_2550118 [Mycena olivaceomarginata]
MTVQSKGRLQPQTQDLGRTKSLQHLAPATEKKSSNVTTHLITTTTKRPFGDKTPFPNRQQQQAQAFATPLPGGEGKLAKLVLDPSPKLEVAPHGTTPASAPRPSATRTHVRAPRTSGRFSHLQFQTPAVNGRPWDVSPMAPSPEPLLFTLDSLSAEPEEDFDEVEYMPPKPAVELWTPPEEWHLPDYGEVGREMRRRAEGWCDYDDERPVDIEVEEMKVDWAMPQLEMAELESDDPFALALALPSAPPTSKQQVPTRRPLATRTATVSGRTTTTTTTASGSTSTSPYARTIATTRPRARAATTAATAGNPYAPRKMGLRTGATASTPASSAAAAPGGRAPRGRPPARGTTATTRPAPVPPGPAKWPPAVTTRAPTAGEIAARAAADAATPAPAAAAARVTRVGTGTRPRAATTRAPVAPSAFRMGAGALRTGPGASTPVAGAGGGGGGRTSVAAATRAPSVLRTSRPPTAAGGRRVVAAGIDPIEVELGADAGEGPTGEEEEFLFDV